MTMKPKSIEERVSELEREVALLKEVGHSSVDVGAGPGFAEEGQSSLSGDALDAKPGMKTMEQRVARLEAEVAELRSCQAGR